MRVFASPQEYIQGADAFQTQLHRLKRLGRTALLITDRFVMQMVGETLLKNLTKGGFVAAPLLIDEEVEAAVFAKAAATVSDLAVDFVIALGGGKAMDMGKIIAHQQKLPIAVLPTSAATDAATSRISVRYDDEGNFLRYDFYPTNPEIVLVDTKVIMAAPAFMLLSGFADGVATYLEARSVRADGGNSTIGEKPTLAAYSLAKTCHDVLLRDIQQALAAQKEGQLNAAFENVVEANILLSGLGFENGGLSLAHAFHNVLMGSPDILVEANHGQIVAVGVLCQLLAEQRADEYHFYQKLFADLGLPVTLKSLSVELTDLETTTVAQAIINTKEAGNHIPANVTPADLIEALKKLI